MSAEDDPVTAEYDVFITPSLSEQIQLLQYVNRPRKAPYNERFGSRPSSVRLKPKSGFLEIDIDMHTSINFNRYQSLKWGDAVQTARSLQNDNTTYGPASGFSAPRTRPGNRASIKDKADRDNQILNDLTDFSTAEAQQKILRAQTLGGKINKSDVWSDGAQPVYLVGAFRGKELHLSRVNGTVQMRPQFHHIDAEDQRTRTANSRAAAATDGESNRPPAPARALQQSYKDLNDDKDKDAPERKMRKLLQDAEEEEWSQLRYIDEQDEEAFDTFNDAMFLHDPTSAPSLKSQWDEERYLNEISPARHAPHARRKKRLRKKDTIEIDANDSDNEHD